MTAIQRAIPIIALLFLVLLPDVAAAEVKIVATLGDLAATARAVGGEDVDVELLARPEEDPHFVDAKPSFVRHVSRADLLMVNGMSLEIGWLPTLVQNARNPKIRRGEPGYFDASTVVEKKGVPDQKIDRSMGDVHPEGNPHFTLAPRQVARVALALGKRLGRLDAANASAYQKRARAFAKKCLLTHRKWKKKFDALPDEKRKVVVYHDTWVYALDWLDLDEVITVEPKPGVKPNPKHVARVLEEMKSSGAKTILQMEYYASSTVERIAEKAEATVVTSQGHTRDGKSYIDRIDALGGAIYEAVK